ncbi:MAG: PaaI family thioesterase [Chloroflexi bacterium]|nr:PaaI family thioesterase [Chloroflexota bacterium]
MTSYLQNAATLQSPPLYVQDGLFGNSCFGCGAWNERGLNIKSSWDGDVSVCRFTPQSHHAAMPYDIVNGGIIAAVIDCHSVCTAIADAYKRADRYAGDGKRPLLWYATASLLVNYLKPTPLSMPFTVRARVTGVDRRRTSLEAELVSDDGTLTCTGEVIAAQVSDRWARDEGYYGDAS